jgi:hypothetical protein
MSKPRGSLLASNATSLSNDFSFNLDNGVEALDRPPVIYLNINPGAYPKGFNQKEFKNSLKERLIQNGFNSNLQIKNISEGNSLVDWWYDVPTATVNIVNPSISRGGHANAGGHSRLGSNSAILYNGLNINGRNRSFPTWMYVNAAMHELGHGIFGFDHDKNGFTDDPNSIMDYRSGLYKNKIVNFSIKEQLKIRSSIWGIWGRY